MKMFVLLLIAMALLAGAGAAAAASGRISPGEPDPLSRTRSLGDVIASATGKPVHIIYVHGMRAKGPRAAEPFVAELARKIGHEGRKFTPSRTHLELGPWPEQAQVGTETIWRTAADWTASRPFVDRYELKGAAGETIIVDELNWWPLLFPLKCRFILYPERHLAGPDETHLRLCARDDAPFHPWISQEELEEALSREPLSGGGVKLNRSLKHQIMNWGLSDAVIALGPMRIYINEAVNRAFAMAEAGAKGVAKPEYVVISESLGSFAVLDAFEEDKGAVKSVLEKTHNLYFLANQFALLDLGRIRNLPASVPAGEAALPLADDVRQLAPPSPLAALEKWAQSEERLLDDRGVKQVIAFSDPSDVLTYRVPPISGAVVANVYVRNGGSLLGLVAHPVKAHAGHIQNPRVIRAMLERTRN